MKVRILGRLATVSFLAMQGQWAYAQQTPQQGAPDGIQDIIVTAQKRSESVNDVPMSISALSADTLKARQINTISDLAVAVPSLSVAASPRNTPIFTLRGIGTNDGALSASPAVSVYLDQFPLPYSVLATHSQFDLERVEVLKGPQGTLFGQNATGGAINLIAAKPTDHFEAGGQFTYGRFNQIDGEAFVSGPLSDTLKGRLAIRAETADGWQVSNSRPGDRNGRVRNFMGRALLDFNPADGIELKLNVNGWIDKSDTQAPQFIAIKPAFSGVPNQYVTPDKLSPEKDRAADWTPDLPYADNSLYQIALRGDFELGSGITLTSLSSYVKFKMRQREDLDGLTESTIDNQSNVGSISNFSQEVRLANDPREDFKWVLGGNFSRSKINQAVTIDVSDSSTNAILTTIGYPVTSDTNEGDQIARDVAVFGNLEYKLTDTLSARAGGRYTWSSRRADLCAYDDIPDYWIGKFFYDVQAGGVAGPYVPGACYAINNLTSSDGVISAPAFNYPGRLIAKLKEENFSWQAGLDWSPTRQTLIYGTISKGYKAGGFPNIAASTFSQYVPVKQESVVSYEGGFKVATAGGRAQLNGSAFYYDYTDKQLQANIVDPVWGVLSILQNVPKVIIKGAELDFTFVPVRGLTLNVQGTYLDAKIDKFVGITSAGVAGDFAGTRVPYTPKYQLNGNADYKFAVNPGLDAFVGSTVSYRSSTVADIGGDRSPPEVSGLTLTPYVIDSYALVDFRAGLSASDGRWRAMAWIKNVGNKYYWTNASLATDSISRYAGRPRTFGLTLAMSFK
ncbi:Outer membrane receptor proteins, mostly Fe transport [Sphingobium faniae]|nr:Outer membrane receptor proteins, mostly Fe transport [Sphingobium faniae]